MSKERHIYCLEGNWNKHPSSHQSIRPILELLNTFCKVKYIYRKCQTKEDFIDGLYKFTHRRYANYAVLYIAFHGKKNRIIIENESITLKEIANVLEGKLKGKIVHFGCCSTLGTTEKNISDFVCRTGCFFVSGYARDVLYIASTAFDLLYFEVLQGYSSLRKIRSVISDRYSFFVDRLRFTIR